MINKVVIIGNGFDIDQGLNTSYQDFLENGIQTPVFETNQILNHIQSLRDQLQPNWSDLELVLAKLLMTDVSNLDESIWNENLSKGYIQVTRLLKSYIASEQRYFTQSQKFNSTRPSYAFLENLHASEFENITIFDFNYTNTVQNILSSLPLKGNIEHIKVHGSIDQDEIIFGVENYGDIRIPSKFVYAKKSNSPVFYNGRIADKMISTNEIHIFGHSLGESDEVHLGEYFSRVLNPNEPDLPTIKQIFKFHLNPSNREIEMTRINGRIDELSGSLADFKRSVRLEYI